MAVTWEKIGYFTTELTVDEQEVVGRLTGGNLDGIALGIADNNVVQIDDADVADNDYAKFTAAGLEGRSYSEVMGDLSGQAAAPFSMGTQKISGVLDPTADQEAATKKYVDDRVTKQFEATIESPADGDDIRIGFTNKAITITEMRCVLVAGTSVLWSVYHHTARATAVASGAEVCTAGTTTLTSDTDGSDIPTETDTFDDATVPADRFLVLSIETVTGAVTEFGLTIFYTVD